MNITKSLTRRAFSIAGLGTGCDVSAPPGIRSGGSAGCRAPWQNHFS